MKNLNGENMEENEHLTCPDCGLPLEFEIFIGYGPDEPVAVECENGHCTRVQVILGKFNLTGENYKMDYTEY